MVVEIYFHSEVEFNYFKRLILHEAIIVKEAKKQTGFTLQLKHESDEELVYYFIHVYMALYLQSQIKKVIREHYFYTNEENIDHIVQWTNSLLQDPSFMKSQFNDEILFNYLAKLLAKQFQQMPMMREYIYFDTFILFQLKSFHHKLIHIVGYAIDEMKREEEYQHFVQTARAFIRKQPPQVTLLHIVQDDEYFHFYDQEGNELGREMLVKKMQGMPLYLFGLDDTELHIAPVLSLLPERIHIYGREETEGKTITLLKIYEERAQFLSISQFPFVK